MLCLGALPTERLVLGIASGPGNLAVLLGSSTGRDGIGGVSVLASAGFSGDDAGAGDDTKRPSVQVGDPFEEKRLIEACLELLDTKLVVGIQDLGGAGLACATSETAGRGGVGMDVDVSAVPRREDGMEPWEVMTSESQERMLAIVTPESWPAVVAICAKWEVRATVIGTVTAPDPAGGGRLRIRDGLDGPILADVPAASLSDDAPLYDRPRQAPARRREPPPESPADAEADLLALLRSARWVYRQYDHQLFLNTVVGPGADAALLRLAGPGLPRSDRGVAVTTDSNPRACALDPRGGTALVLAEGGRQPRLRRGDARRGGQLPQLRQPRASRGDVAALRVASTAWPRPAAPCRSRSSAATSASTTRAAAPTSTRRRCSGSSDSSTTYGRHRRASAWAEGDAVVLLGAACGGRRFVPLGGHPLGHRVRAATAPERHRLSTSPSIARVCAFVAGAGRRAGGG